jgi:hypothetical protein
MVFVDDDFAQRAATDSAGARAAFVDGLADHASASLKDHIITFPCLLVTLYLCHATALPTAQKSAAEVKSSGGFKEGIVLLNEGNILRQDGNSCKPFNVSPPRQSGFII